MDLKLFGKVTLSTCESSIHILLVLKLIEICFYYAFIRAFPLFITR